MSAAMHSGILKTPFLSKRCEIEASKRIEKKSGKKRGTGGWEESYVRNLTGITTLAT